MALVRKGLVSVAKRGLSSQIMLIPFKSQRSFWNEPSSADPLLKKLLQVPSSLIKTTLDSYDRFALRNSEFSWNALVAGLPSLSSEKAQLVLEWKLEKMLKDSERDYDQYLNLMSLCAKTQNVPLAMHVFTSMEAHGIKPTASVFNSLLHACLCSNDVITAFSLFEIMESSEGYKPDAETYETFIIGFSSLGNAVAMKSWYSAKKAAGYCATLQTYESLISGCVKSGDFDSADKFYEEITSIGIMPNERILENLLEGFCRQRRFSQAKELLKSFLDVGRGISVKMAEKIVRLYSEYGKVEEMEDLLSTVVESGQVVEVMLQVHSGIIRMYAALNRLDDVEYSVGRMLKQGLSFRCTNDVEKVICCYFRKEAYDRLDIFLEHIKGSHKLSKSTYDLLIAGYRRAGLSQRLDLVIKDMELSGVL
ncbi:Tetratricopeptide repeat-like superfamily protein, putative [Theobroma cacao]|uniref:Tetratricopeptide repeat-like superfamily protein, putative n=1 Tax=Theobroma cacao TaxID=3641 RepID=A0A061FZA9_THECC|nr:Tetratricopeptide repeat-like superfamily protein, putative [Theobroma cacao]